MDSPIQEEIYSQILSVTQAVIGEMLIQGLKDQAMLF